MKKNLIILILALYLSPSIYAQRTRFSEECIIDSMKGGHIYLTAIRNQVRVREITYDLVESAQTITEPLSVGQLVLVRMRIENSDPPPSIEMVKLPGDDGIAPFLECVIDSIKGGRMYLTGIWDNVKGKSFDILCPASPKHTYGPGDVVLLKKSLWSGVPEFTIAKLKVPCQAMSPCRTLWQQVD